MSNAKTDPTFFEYHEKLRNQRPTLQWRLGNVRGDVCDVIVYYDAPSGLKEALRFESEYAPEFEDEILSEIFSHMYDVCGLEPDMYIFECVGL